MHERMGRAYTSHCRTSHIEIRLFFLLVILLQGHDYLLAGIQEWLIHCTDENVVHKSICIKDRQLQEDRMRIYS